MKGKEGGMQGGEVEAKARGCLVHVVVVRVAFWPPLSTAVVHFGVGGRLSSRMNGSKPGLELEQKPPWVPRWPAEQTAKCKTSSLPAYKIFMTLGQEMQTR